MTPSTRPVRRRWLLRVLAAVALVAGWAVPSAAPAAAQDCAGVWVVVDRGSLGGGTSTSCATAYGTGTAALRSAGFGVSLDNGMIVRINNQPASPDIHQAYWSYWHSARLSDGSYGSWVYSNLGAGSYQPKTGDAEGWRYVALSEGYVSPSVSPPKQTTTAPAPTAAATTKAATTKPATTRAAATTTTQAAGNSAVTSATAGPATALTETTAPPTNGPTPEVASLDPSDGPASSSPAVVRPGASSAGPLTGVAAVVVVLAGAGGVVAFRARRGRVR